MVFRVKSDKNSIMKVKKRTKSIVLSHFYRKFAFKIGYLQMQYQDVRQAEEQARLFTTRFDEWQKETTVLDGGYLVLCLSGSAEIHVDFTCWHLYRGAVIALFPNDVVQLCAVSDDFTAETLSYSASLLREASLQLEAVVYESLRADRCRTDAPIVTNIIRSIFSLLRLYFEQKDCTCLTQMVLLQLKSFFLGFYDYLYRHPSQKPDDTGTQRVNELFQRFMSLLERDYRRSRDVDHYAHALHISAKYLNAISHTKTLQSTKNLIDSYVIMQLKLLLRTSSISIKEVSCLYHFSNLSFFCRYFRTHASMSPKAYKQRFVHGSATQQTV